MAEKLLWNPTPERVERATITRFARAVGREGSYEDLWRWSVDDLEGFWAAVWDCFEVRASQPYERVLGRREMPGAQWFAGARLSYAEHFFRDRDDDAVAIRHAAELRELAEWTWGELRDQTARIATGLRSLGVGPGDRVAAYMPNIPETIAAFLAAASIGAVWSSAAPEFGARSVIDRFAQIEPKVLLAIDGYRYGGRDFDRRDVVAGIAAEIGAHVVTFGTSASYIASCMKAGVEPRAGRDLSALRAVGSTGSPLSPEGFDWVYEHVGADTWLFSTSGGSDLCTAFVGGVPTLPVYEGELQARSLGAKVEAFDEDGNSLVGEVGELVLTEPMPSMPVGFWGDSDGSRLRESYFSTYPGVWRHGDWIEITSRGTAIIYGRSDSTINRGGIRMGTSEIYRAVLAVDEVVDALVVDVPREGTDGWMPLFVVLREGARLDDDLVKRIKARVREDCSPRHVPNEVHAIAEVPRTLSGKALEVPVKRILMGQPPDKAASRESLANPGALDYFVELAAE